MSIQLSPVTVGLSAIVFVALAVIRLVASRAAGISARSAEELNEIRENHANRSDNAPAVVSETSGSVRRRSSRSVRLFSALGLILLVASGLAQPGAAYLPRTHSFLVNYGDQLGPDSFLIDFAARQFSMVDEQDRSMGRWLRTVEPGLPVLSGHEMEFLYPTIGGYATLNATERAFMHSYDPANLLITKSGGKMTISWANDRRYSHSSIQGYRIRLAADSNALGTPYDTVLKGRSITLDSLLTDGQFLHIGTVVDSNHESWYSLPVRINSATLGGVNNRIDSITSADFAATRDSLYLRISVDGTITPDSVFAQVDIQSHRYPPRNMVYRRYPLTYNAPYWSISYNWPRNDPSHPCGHGFRVVICHGAARDTLPSGGWLYTTNVNNRVINYEGDELFNSTDSTWQAWMIAGIAQQLASPNYYGVFLDETPCRCTWYQALETPLDKLVYDCDTTTWIQGMKTIVARIDTLASPGPVFYNWDNAPENAILLPYCSGGMDEDVWSPYNGEDVWQLAENQILVTCGTYHETFLALCCASTADTVDRLYRRASYLLAARDSSWYGCSSYYGLYAHYPEMDLYLGKPLDSAVTNITELQQPAGYYLRHFTQGDVLVNPTSNTVTIGNSWPANEVMVSSANTINNGRIYTVPFSGTTLASHQGLILLNSPLNPPQVSNVTFYPPRPQGSSNKVMARVTGCSPLYVEAALSRIHGGLHVAMNDSGTGGDVRADDSIYTGTFSVPGGTLVEDTVWVLAYDTTGMVQAVKFMFDTTSWVRKADVPAGPRSKTVKDGGALAASGTEDICDNDSGFVYAFKGNNSCEFYRYNPASLAWVSRDSIPAVNRLGKKKTVKKGGALIVGTDGKVYGTKGSNTLDFWRYDPTKPAGTTWSQLADVPAGTKALNEGTGLASVNVSGTNCVYLLKGSGTCEFYRYNITADSWTTMASAPSGALGKPYKYGSSIAYGGTDTIYCLKGAYNEFFAYSISGNNWVTEEALPRVAPPLTKKTQVRNGSQIASNGEGTIYALKGNNTNEFWSYEIGWQEWLVANAMPTVRKRVSGGGGLTYSSKTGLFYALRGNNTLEFWAYNPSPMPYTPEVNPNGTTGGAQVNLTFKLSVAPNPFVRAASVSYSLPRAGNISLKLYDVSGKLAATLASGYATAGSHRALVNADKFAHGIYLLRFESESNTTTEKLIIE
jgi:hypothetical protein